MGVAQSPGARMSGVRPDAAGKDQRVKGVKASVTRAESGEFPAPMSCRKPNEKSVGWRLVHEAVINARTGGDAKAIFASEAEMRYVQKRIWGYAKSRGYIAVTASRGLCLYVRVVPSEPYQREIANRYNRSLSRLAEKCMANESIRFQKHKGRGTSGNEQTTD